MQQNVLAREESDKKAGWRHPAKTAQWGLIGNKPVVSALPCFLYNIADTTMHALTWF